MTASDKDKGMGKKAKKVSIVIPTFNQDAYLQPCIDHCLFQSYRNIELIIVDGGSTDNTKTILRGLDHRIAQQSISPVIHMDEGGSIIRKTIRTYPQDREIVTVLFETDIGATRTYNEGLKRVSGEYCTYVAGDDLPHPHMIENLVTALEESHADFAYSDMNVVDDDGCIVRQMRLPDYSFDDCFAKWFHLGVSHLYHSKWHQKVGLMDEGYTSANDYDHYLRFAMAGATFYHLPQILYSIRYHGENRKTGQHSDERYRNLLEECKQCAIRAREWMGNRNAEHSLKTR